MAWQREHVVALLLGIVLGWLGVHLLLPEAPSFQPKRIYPSRYEIGAASSLAPPIPTAREGFPEAASPKEGAATAAATPPLSLPPKEGAATAAATPPLSLLVADTDGSNASLFAECVERIESASTTADDIVLAVLTTVARHELIETLREHWLRDAKALLLTDAPGLVRRCPHSHGCRGRLPWYPTVPLPSHQQACTRPLAVALLLSGRVVRRSERRRGRRWSCGRATQTAARPTAARRRCTTLT